jgi:hypothetical protein
VHQEVVRLGSQKVSEATRVTIRVYAVIVRTTDGISTAILISVAVVNDSVEQWVDIQRSSRRRE